VITKGQNPDTKSHEHLDYCIISSFHLTIYGSVCSWTMMHLCHIWSSLHWQKPN